MTSKHRAFIAVILGLTVTGAIGWWLLKSPAARAPAVQHPLAVPIDAATVPPPDAALATHVDPDRPIAVPDDISPLIAELRIRSTPYGRLVRLSAEGVTGRGSLDPESGKLGGVFLREVAPAEAPASGTAKLANECHELEYQRGTWEAARRVTYPGYCDLLAKPRIYWPRCTFGVVVALAKLQGSAPAAAAKVEYGSVLGAEWSVFIPGTPNFFARVGDVCR